MKISLDRITSVSFAVYFLGVLTIGSLSIWHTQNMMNKTVAIAEESRDVDFINQLLGKTSSMVQALQGRVPAGSGTAPARALALADEIEDEIDRYIKSHDTRRSHDISEELTQVAQLHESLQQLRQVSYTTDAPDTMRLALLEQHAGALESRVRRVNQLHFEYIGRDVERVRESMSSILVLYVVFSVLGMALLVVSYRMHSRHVVQPVQLLQTSAERVAGGDLGVRLQTDSRTEIGALYRAFNRMIEQLQAQDRQQRQSQQLLEEKVHERTLQLGQTHRSLQAAQADLMRMEKAAMLGQIATSVNHEVRTPLNALYMNVQLIKRSLESSRAGVATERRSHQQEVLERIGTVNHEVARISDMLEEFVNYARLPAPVLEATDPNRLVNHVADMLRARAAQSKVQIGLELAAPAPAVQADENKLTQVLVNLATNALQAMPDGGTLTLATAADGGEIKVTVADTGSGIAPEHLGRIFQPFFTTKPRGLGFGLAIVQRIVEQHGGQIECQSRAGAGTVFTIRLPLAAAA
ncbi:MAG: ATP-binding protein [Rubrivivax sp.]|nr:ATP-binding protein [Rubrivivax sp.]